jgi:capsular polysaccharide biosynthesis protein
MKLSFKFFPIKDLFYSVVPTAGTYGGYIQGVAPEFFPNVWIAIILGLILSIILAVVF